MSTYRFELQRVDRAFNSIQEIPERLWARVSRHTSLTAARKAIEKAGQEMARAIGGNCWNGHNRIVALVDTPMKAQSHCDGGHIGGYVRSPQCEQQVTVEFVWPAGERCPEAPLPWHSICPACQALETEQMYGNED